MKTETIKTLLVKDILPGVLNSISRRDINEQISLEKLWQDIMGKDADRAVITGFRDGCVVVLVPHPTLLFKMRLKRQELLKKLQEKRSDIVNIAFRIGKTS